MRGARLGDRTPEVWDAQRGRRLSRLRGHSGFVNSVAFDSAGRGVVTASADKTARVWDAATGTMRLVLRGHDGPVESAAFGPGDVVATGSADGTARLWDAAPPRPVARVRLGGSLPPWAWPLRELGRGDKLAASDDGRRAVMSKPGGTRVVELPGRQTIATLRWGTATPEKVVFSGDGTRILAIFGDANVVGGSAPPSTWDAGTGRRVAIFGNDAYIYDGAFDADGRRVVTGGENGVVRVWRAADGNLLETVGRAADRVHAVAFSPDGTHVAAAGLDPSACIWQLGAVTAPILLTGAGDAIGVAYSPDGGLVVTSGARARVWDAAAGEELLDLPQQDVLVPAARFSTDGEGVITFQEEGETVWARLYPCSACGDADAVIARARARRTRDLTAAERRAFLGG